MSASPNTVNANANTKVDSEDNPSLVPYKIQRLKGKPDRIGPQTPIQGPLGRHPPIPLPAAPLAANVSHLLRNSSSMFTANLIRSNEIPPNSLSAPARVLFSDQIVSSD